MRSGRSLQQARTAVVAVTSLMLVATACASEDDASINRPSGVFCTDGPTDERLDEAGVASEVCFEADRTDGVFVRAIGLRDGSAITITGGAGDTAEFEWIEAEAGSLVNGVPRFGALLDGQIVSSPLRVTGTWSDGTPMQLTLDW